MALLGARRIRGILKAFAIAIGAICLVAAALAFDPVLRPTSRPEACFSGSNGAMPLSPWRNVFEKMD